MDLWMYVFYIFAGSIMFSSIFVFFIVINKQKAVAFRYFPLVQFALLFYLIVEFLLFQHKLARPELFLTDVEWMTRVQFGMYGVFMICRFIFFNSLLDVSGRAVKFVLFPAIMLIYFGMLFTPFFWNGQTHSPGWGYFLCQGINITQIAYFLVTILLFGKRVEDEVKRKLLGIWKILIVFYLPFIVFQGYFHLVFLLQKEYENVMRLSSFLYILGGVSLVMLVNIAFLGVIRTHVLSGMDQPVQAKKGADSGVRPDTTDEKAVSQRESEIMRLIAAGKSNKEICQTLYISLPTVKTHIYNIYRKLSVRNRVELINRMNDTGGLEFRKPGSLSG
ncbi:MAG: hypothetical protein A2Y33_12190 [Spirochaetes bacterium GWF1_51_8]|nr:MAG: hypothetical protein A2Y33_12190 [Spirochaetes bacterium GWF1_51_8]